MQQRLQRPERPLEEPPGRLCIAPGADQYVDELAVLVDRLPTPGTPTAHQAPRLDLERLESARGGRVQVAPAPAKVRWPATVGGSLTAWSMQSCCAAHQAGLRLAVRGRNTHSR
jgi:hypothetical protein